MRRVFVSNSQPIRFPRFDGKSVNRRPPVLDQTRAPRSLPQARRIMGSGDENGWPCDTKDSNPPFQRMESLRIPSY